MTRDDLDLSQVGYVHRIVIGSDDPMTPARHEVSAQAMELLNRCLSEVPKGRIIAIEKSSAVYNLKGESQAVFQWVVYHVGFVRKPPWLAL